MKKLVEKILICTLCMLFSFSLIDPVFAKEKNNEKEKTVFRLVDYGNEDQVVKEFSKYNDAYRQFNKLKDKYSNLGIAKDDKVYRVEYGIVLINQEKDDEHLDFLNVKDRSRNFTSGKRGIDAAYIDTDQKGKVRFFLSGVEGETSVDSVSVVPVEKIAHRLSSYVVKDDNLYHEIKEEMDDDYYSNIVKVGEHLEYLEEGSNYLSYDGHYFYQDTKLKEMLDDYKNQKRDHSVNPKDPYYDYYQFVSHRTLTGVTSDELENYVKKSMGIRQSPKFYQDDDRNLTSDLLSFSLLHDNVDPFYQYQYEYGANALMMFAMSENETNDGRSLTSFLSNNLFNHAAFDDELEAEAKRYFSAERSIYAHARYYISGSYCSPMKPQYHGGFFGNKANGMNVAYSSDPYWGEKAASFYRRLDEHFGNVDKNRYTIGIRTKFNATPVYREPKKGSPQLYQTGKMNDMAFVILQEIKNEDGEFYKIQADATLSEQKTVTLNYHYDFQQDVGYIKKSDIQLILNGKHHEKDEYFHVTFDANEGTFSGNKEKVEYALGKNEMPMITVPEKPNALFDGWDHQLEPLTKDTTYVAQYRDVDHIEMSSFPIKDYFVNDQINIDGGSVRVFFKDGKQMVQNLDLSMIRDYDMSQIGEQEVTVVFAGCETSYPIEIKEDAELNKLREDIIALATQVNSQEGINQQQKDELITFKEKMDEIGIPYFNMPQIRVVDHALREAIGDKVRYCIGKNNLNLSASGFTLGTNLGNSLSKAQLFEDTYRVKIHDGVSNRAYSHLLPYANYLGEPVGKGMYIHIYKNYHKYPMDGSLILSIQKPNSDQFGDVYSVLQLLPDGNVKKCYTRQSKNTISFMVHEGGNYQLVKRRTSNEYDEKDPVEVLTKDNQSFDVEMVWTVVSLLGASIVAYLYISKDQRKKNKEEKVEQLRKEKDEEEKNKPLPPADVTQALEKLNTEMIRLEEIRAAERELDKEHENDQ